MIILSDLTFGYPKRRRLFENVNCEFLPGEKIGILGRAGSGKSVLGKLLCGSEQAIDGAIYREGRVSWPLGFAGVFHPELTGLENLKHIASILGEDSDEMIEVCMEVGKLQSELQRKLKHFTPAKRAMISYCCSISIPCDWYIADEKLTVGVGGDFERSESALKKQLGGAGLVFMSKNINQVRKYCDRFFAIIDSQLIEFESVDLADAALKVWDERDSEY